MYIADVVLGCWHSHITLHVRVAVGYSSWQNFQCAVCC